MIKLYLTECVKALEHDTGVKLARHALFDTFGTNALLQKDALGKPYFADSMAHVSISHSKGRCLVAISDSEIGADIEYKIADKNRLMRISNRYFTRDEADFVLTEPRRRFFDIWCAKESYIKYTGEGFSRPLTSFSVLKSDMCFSHFDIDNYHICVCSREHTFEQPKIIPACEL